MTKLTLFTKPGCHLCDDMKLIVANVKNDPALEIDMEEINIEISRDIFEKYKEKIPVLFIEGKMFAKFRLDEQKLRRKIQTTNKHI
ncbi:MAG: glutaredoxin family protein [bacterium]